MRSRWRATRDLAPGDRIEVGFVVMRVDEVLDDDEVLATRERDGAQTTARASFGRFRYVGPPGSDPEQRLERREARTHG